uniref:GyrI-like domain-containing protein n=1 Tax=uncultured Draconibacterium sp. TaxID=1573823 RepID=UPI00321750BE
METKKIETTLVAKHSFTTTLAEVMAGKFTQPQKLMNEVAAQGFKVHVPHIWNYIDCDGKMDSQFTLEMCIPVEKKGKDTDFIRFSELPEVKCVSHIYNGPYTEMGPVYEKLFGDLEKNKQIPTGNCREVYLHWEMENQEKNITEIQIEVQ